MSKDQFITLEVISNGLLSIAEQMGVILTKTAYSTNIKERKDLSVAIFDADGRVLSLAQHIPIHSAPVRGRGGGSEALGQIRNLRRRRFIANDPYSGGGSHLPDIALVRPVFFEGKLIAFVVNNGHHADRSRRGPTIYDEGLRIPVVKLYEKGKLNQDNLRPDPSELPAQGGAAGRHPGPADHQPVRRRQGGGSCARRSGWIPSMSSAVNGLNTARKRPAPPSRPCPTATMSSRIF